MSTLEWERTGHRITALLTAEALRRKLRALSGTRDEWIAICRGRTWLYLNRMGPLFDVTFQDELDATWRVWRSEPRPEEAGGRADLEQAVVLAMEYAGTGLVAGVLRDANEDHIRARGLKERLASELASAAEAATTPAALAIQLHLDRVRPEAAVSVLAGGWSGERRARLPDTTRQLEFLAIEAPWCSSALPRVFLEVLAELSLPAGVIPALVLDELPVEHAMATAELVGGPEATTAWRSAVPHDVARLWTYRGDVQKLGKGLAREREPNEEKVAGQTGFDFG